MAKLNSVVVKLILTAAILAAMAYASYLVFVMYITDGKVFAALATVGFCAMFYAIICIWDR